VTLPTLVAGGVHKNVQDVVSTVEKTNVFAPDVDVASCGNAAPVGGGPAANVPAVDVSSNPPVPPVMATVMVTGPPPGVYAVAPETVMPLPAVSVPWHEAQVPSPGAPAKPSGGLAPNEYMIAGTDMIATIVVANIAALRPFVPDRIAPLRNIKDFLLLSNAFLNFCRTLTRCLCLKRR
jgi:hypothetical protein